MLDAQLRKDGPDRVERRVNIRPGVHDRLNLDIGLFKLKHVHERREQEVSEYTATSSGARWRSSSRTSAE